MLRSLLLQRYIPKLNVPDDVCYGMMRLIYSADGSCTMTTGLYQGITVPMKLYG